MTDVAAYRRYRLPALNELHQAGWRIVPREASRVDARRIPAELLDVAGAEDLSGVHSDAEGSL